MDVKRRNREGGGGEMTRMEVVSMYRANIGDLQLRSEMLALHGAQTLGGAQVRLFTRDCFIHISNND